MTESTLASAAEEAALPPDPARAHAVRMDGLRGVEDEKTPDPSKRRPRSPAEWAYRRLALYMAKFEEGLAEGEEMAMTASAGGASAIRIRGMGHFDPDIVTFYGIDPAGVKVQLIQHVSQLSVLLRALPKAGRGRPYRIGFDLRRDLEEGPEPGTAPADGVAP
ncbi:hypothetical protein BCF33_2494 [Hasllibacter halocynthiae]|uniref:Uncharacterized protein n=1 Tax=Hasllibacter halocynthiae TaxID=595589 RepID=A0A2T0X423_9RHOB|nr:DUF6173 family protein [Hasllibacter halocynthiae]PRY93614.1 hypothetical protein BCF33_2494 [Hasllibacter halocynthiae]